MRVTAKTRLKIMACRVCDKPLRVGSNTRNAPRCDECSVAAYETSAREIASRSGPAYEKYIAGLRDYAANPTRGRESPS